MKKSVKKPTAKKATSIKKAQLGKSVKASADSTDFYTKHRDSWAKRYEKAVKNRDYEDAELSKSIERRYGDDVYRQSKKGVPGYDEHGRSTFKPKSPKQQISEGVKKKMKSGGAIKAKAKKK